MVKIFLGRTADVPLGKSKTFVSGGKKILVANVGGTFKAYENFCPHMGGAMRYDGKRLVCGWHGAQFDPTTGDAKGGVAEGTKLKPMTVVAEGDSLYLESEGVAKSPWADDFS
jgi:nitrite reductase/ring-hydroxylating ferredoxin subunit